MPDGNIGYTRDGSAFSGMSDGRDRGPSSVCRLERGNCTALKTSRPPLSRRTVPSVSSVYVASCAQQLGIVQTADLLITAAGLAVNRHTNLFLETELPAARRKPAIRGRRLGTGIEQNTLENSNVQRRGTL